MSEFNPTRTAEEMAELMTASRAQYNATANDAWKLATPSPAECMTCKSIALLEDDYPEQVTTAKWSVTHGGQTVLVCARHEMTVLDALLAAGQTAQLQITKLR